MAAVICSFQLGCGTPAQTNIRQSLMVPVVEATHEYIFRLRTVSLVPHPAAFDYMSNSGQTFFSALGKLKKRWTL
jgi:hypothetical protein